ncbi:hypothetical protein RF656_16870 [Yersinia kristensenii]|nr:hypothetical protein [Yersinia kristensenii]MDR4898400.1 hypothetical protein [Yersinia kristensenii]MDX6735361.1 hypothetical protein [Yersinia kristensenii]
MPQQIENLDRYYTDEGLDKGAAIVTFTAAGGGFTAACNFTVTEA